MTNVINEVVQRIDLTHGGKGKTYTVTTTDINGVSLAAFEVFLSVGSLNDPGTWYDSSAPEMFVTRPADNQIVSQLMLGTTIQLPAGMYWVWRKIDDGTNVDIVRTSLVILVS